MRSRDEFSDHTIAERFAHSFASMEVDALPASVRSVVVTDLIDVAGLCIAARGTQYVRAAIEACDDPARCTALGHDRALSATGAALVNGTAAHGEDFDDTLEGSPAHVGAVVVPAVLATCERHGLAGADAVRGIAAGLELMCRLNRTVPGGMHQACFHPTAVTGTFGAAFGAGVALGLSSHQLTMALGIAGSLCSGIIEYLTDGAWTKRLHAGWAAQSGVQAAHLARRGFTGPRTVFEGDHNAFRAFSPAVTPDYDVLVGGLGEVWIAGQIAFKPYACGTMIHPYIDCMLRLAGTGVDAASIVDMECKTSELIVHRLWEPLSDKQAPANPYSAKFSVPYCLAVAFHDGAVGLEQFTDARLTDPAVRSLAAKVRYVVDPDDEYPDNYTGHLRVRFTDGSVESFHQPHFRGGVHAPLTREEITAKFRRNVRYGGWSGELQEALLDLCLGIEQVAAPLELGTFRG
ncbi:MAG: MmgE/PrpD family protein [Gammaproteobacteria bacterium]